MTLKDDLTINPITGRLIFGPPFTKLGLIGALALLFLIVYLMRDKTDLYRYGKVTNSIVVNIVPETDSSTKLIYLFILGNNFYKGERTYPNLTLLEAKKLLFQSLPTLYAKDAPESNRILIREKDFYMYNLTQPDSLNKYQELFKK